MPPHGAEACFWHITDALGERQGFKKLPIRLGLITDEERRVLCAVVWKAAHQLHTLPQPYGRTTMKIFNSVVIVGPLLAVSMSAAAAGPCTAEIENITKLVAARDAGAGPTTGA